MGIAYAEEIVEGRLGLFFSNSATWYKVECFS